MYHYVNYPNIEYPYSRYLDFNNFKKQLDWFSNNGGFVDKDDFIRLINGEPVKNNASGFILTFDDGLYEHYNTVFPELKKRGLWGIFYIPTLPYTKGKVLDVHKIHLLLGKHGGKKMINALEEIVTSDMMMNYHDKDFTDITYSLQKGFDDEVKFKRVLNYYLSYEYRESVLDSLFEQYINTRVKTT